MSARRTPLLEVDQDWSYGAQITKAGHDAQGRRFIQGVASGVLEDADGERVSARAIRKMAAAIPNGLKLTSSHQQDWASEIGDLVSLQHDAKQDELLVKAVLPPEGEDPLADKAWNSLTKYGKRLGFSIGGKLKGAFFEQGDTGKRRKVLDDIDLRHVMLTEVPSYKGSFAQAVAKSHTDAPPEDAEAYSEDVTEEDLPDELVFVDERPDETATTPPAEVDKTQAPEDAPVEKADDPNPDGRRETDADAARDLPVAKHFACPGCGHEFAAPMETNKSQTETGRDTDTAKRRRTQSMDAKHQETLDRIRGLAEGEAVHKTDDTPPEPTRTDDKAPEAEVEKAELSTDALAELVAKSHTANEQGLTALEGMVAEGFGQVAKALTGFREAIEELPRGRKSQARVLPTRDEVEKTETGTDEDVVAKTDDPIAALRALNAKAGIS